ncbi:BRCA1-associated RING domain protein 1-like isoform X1 [Carex rostrata]
MENLRRSLNPLVLNLQKMELELTCPMCLKLLSLPTFLPCNHVSCSHCAAASVNGYGCPLCKVTFRYQDLKPATQIEAVVTIYRSLSSTVSSILIPREQQVDISDTKTPSGGSGSPDTLGNENKMDNFECEQQRLYSITGSKLGFRDARANAIVSNKFDKSNLDAEVCKKGASRADMTTCVEQKGHCGPPLSDDARNIDSDSYDVHSAPVLKGSTKRDAKTGAVQNNDNSIREPKKLKMTENPYNEKSNGNQVNPSIAACGFCHSFKSSEVTGPVSHYLDGAPVNDNRALLPSTLHAHDKCIEWAPQAYFEGDNAMNVEEEMMRASKIKCIKCGLKGAALGCYSQSCRRSYHFLCAHETPGCRWDMVNFLLLCPVHSSKKLPCDRSKSKAKKAKHAGSPSSLTGDLTSSVMNQRGERWITSHAVTREWLFCGSALSDKQKEILEEFGNITGVEVTNNWKSNVTHVISATDEQGGCGRSLKVLMAILGGKWIVGVDWLKACVEAGHPVSEEPFEISHDVYGAFDGPKTGRLRAMQKAPKLFAELSFHFSGRFLPYYKGYLEDLIVAAGGTIIDKSNLSSSSFVVYSTEPPQGSNREDLNEAINKRKIEAEELAVATGSRAVAHTWLLDSIAACSLQQAA